MKAVYFDEFQTPLRLEQLPDPTADDDGGLLIGMLVHQAHEMGRRVAGRLVTGDRERHEELRDLLGGELAAVDLGFEEAVETVTEELGKEGFGVLTEIDVQATLKQKLGEDMPRYRILGACNPALAFQAISAVEDIGLLLAFTTEQLDLCLGVFYGLDQADDPPRRCLDCRHQAGLGLLQRTRFRKGGHGQVGCLGGNGQGRRAAVTASRNSALTKRTRSAKGARTAAAVSSASGSRSTAMSSTLGSASRRARACPPPPTVPSSTGPGAGRRNPSTSSTMTGAW